jgi:hypothetical protein
LEQHELMLHAVFALAQCVDNGPPPRRAGAHVKRWQRASLLHCLVAGLALERVPSVAET